MNKKNISIGIDDFKEIIDEQSYYVDKTLFIKELIDLSAKVTLITRPRRFGKTLNMSMLKYFFEKTEEDNSYLFKDLLIDKQESDKYINEQSKYPLIFLTLKGAKDDTWEETYKSLKMIIANEYKKHGYLLESNIIKFEYDVEMYKNIISLKADKNDYTYAIKNLSKYLKEYHGEDCIILIDEYDTPLQKGYLDGYFDEVLNFMKSFLGESLKGNESLKRGVLTGIMKIAKESIFNDFNNPDVVTILSNDYTNKFGFEEEEVIEMATYYGLENKLEDIKKWYNGYIFGEETVIYNPWSILNYLRKSESGFKPYWLNTGSRDLIKRVLQLDKSESKKIVEALIEGKQVTKELTEHIVYNDIDNNSDVSWSFLLHSGYLKVVDKNQNNRRIMYDLAIPNIEVAIIYEDILKNYFKEDVEISNDLMNLNISFLQNSFDTIKIILKDLYFEFVSVYDVGIKSIDELRLSKQKLRQENFHHGFILGILMYLTNDYDVYSNREYGLGRPDIVLIPKDKNNTSYVFEFKWASTQDKKTLEFLLDSAKTQIKEKKYVEGVKAIHKVEDVVTIAVGFKGKELDIDIE